MAARYRHINALSLHDLLSSMFTLVSDWWNDSVFVFVLLRLLHMMKDHKTGHRELNSYVFSPSNFAHTIVNNP